MKYEKIELDSLDTQSTFIYRLLMEMLNKFQGFKPFILRDCMECYQTSSLQSGHDLNQSLYLAVDHGWLEVGADKNFTFVEDFWKEQFPEIDLKESRIEAVKIISEILNGFCSESQAISLSLYCKLENLLDRIEKDEKEDSNE